MQSIPRVFHFVYGLRPQSAPFPLMHYLCLKSCIAVNRPERVNFHTANQPWGPWWEKIEPQLSVRRIEPSEFVASTGAYARHHEGQTIQRLALEYAHHADFIRLEILLNEGGVYADIDTLFLEPIPDDFYDRDFVMAHEGFEAVLQNGESLPTLCNALIMARAESRFGQSWFERMFAEFDGTWNRHSCVAPTLLAREVPEMITVVPQRHFFTIPPTADGIARLFLPSTRSFSGSNSIHLWEHLWASPESRDFSEFHAGMLTPEYVLGRESLYARLAAPFLQDD